MHNAIAPRSPAARRAIRRERAEAKRVDRASGIRLDTFISILLANPNWDGGQIVKKETR